ncbi:hypothetical protein [Desulfocastanea catecholica]
MAHSRENETSAAKCHLLLRQSIEMYQKIETLYQSIQEELANTSVARVQANMETLNTLLLDVQKIDTLIGERVHGAPSFPEATEKLFAARADVLHRVHQANKRLTDRAENAKALLRHEITTMAINRQAMKGYKPVETERTSIVRSFF